MTAFQHLQHVLQIVLQIMCLLHSLQTWFMSLSWHRKIHSPKKKKRHKVQGHRHKSITDFKDIEAHTSSQKHSRTHNRVWVSMDEGWKKQRHRLKRTYACEHQKTYTHKNNLMNNTHLLTPANIEFWKTGGYHRKAEKVQ